MMMFIVCVEFFSVKFVWSLVLLMDVLDDGVDDIVCCVCVVEVFMCVVCVIVNV